MQQPGSPSADSGPLSRQATPRQLKQASKVLKSLSTASAWADLRSRPAQQQEDILALPWATALAQALPGLLQCGDFGFITPLLKALGAGLCWLAVQADRRQPHPDTALLATKLCVCIGSGLEQYDKSQPPEQQRARAGAKLASLAEEAGLFSTLTSLFNKLAAAISSPAASSSRPGSNSRSRSRSSPAGSQLAYFATVTLGVLFELGRVCDPARLLFGTQLVPAVPAAASLAVAVLRSASAKSAAHVCACLVCKLHDSVVMLNEAGEPLPASVTGSAAVRELLLIGLGLAAAQLHRQLQGRSPVAAAASPATAVVAGAVSGSATAAAAAGTSQEQQPQQQFSTRRRSSSGGSSGSRVPAHHSTLLRALGVPEGLESPLNLSALPVDTMLAHIYYDGWFDLSGVAGVGSSSSTQREVSDAAAAPLFMAQLLLILEIMLLQPCLLDAGLAGMARFVQRYMEKVPAMQMASELLPAMLTMLPAAVKHADNRASSEAAPGQQAAPAQRTFTQQLALVVYVYTSAVVEHPHETQSRSSKEALAATFQQHMAAYCQLLECAVRKQPPSAIPAVCALSAAVAHSSSSSSSSSGGSSISSGSNSSDEQQQQLFALAVSCLKALPPRAAPADRSTAGRTRRQSGSCIKLSVRNFRLLQGLMQAACALADSSSSSSHSRRLWLVLLARCLVALARNVQQLQQAAWPVAQKLCTSPVSHELVSSCQAAVCCITRHLPDVAAAPAPGSAAGPAAPETVVQQLLQQQGLLLQQLEQVKAAAASLGDAADADPPAAEADGAQQWLLKALLNGAPRLEAAGAAVIAQLPVRHCCNHHGCSNLAMDSELELVGGKSCVCSGCLAARYCSRECQVAHYKGWHKAVCKRLQQQRQQQQQ